MAPLKSQPSEEEILADLFNKLIVSPESEAAFVPPSSHPVGLHVTRLALDELFKLRKTFVDIVATLDTQIDTLTSATAPVEANLEAPAEPRKSPLDHLEMILAATRDLRVANGNLSAQRISNVFGVSLSELATWIGRSRQSLNKAPEADTLQTTLAFFERVARLRLRLSDADFRKWLRVPNSLLEGKQPIELLATGRWQVLADFVDDLLTGSPT